MLLGPKYVDWDAAGEGIDSRKRQAARRFAKLKVCLKSVPAGMYLPGCLPLWQDNAALFDVCPRSQLTETSCQL